MFTTENSSSYMFIGVLFLIMFYFSGKFCFCFCFFE